MGTITTLAMAELSVEPGGRAATTIRVRNTGSIVDRFDIDVVGDAAGWASVDPVSLSLFPGAEGTATVTFAPARASTPRAGSVPFGVRVRPAADPAGSAVEEGRISVLPFSNAAADVVPQTSRGRRGARHEVLVDNRGNAPVEVVVTASDPDRRLALAVMPERAIVGPDERVGFHVTVRVDDPFPFGSSRPRPFVVSVEPGRQAPIQLRATLSQGPLLPSWLPRIGGLAVAALAVGVLAFAFGAGPFQPKATATPVAQVATPTPAAASPTPSPSTEAPSVPEVTASPTPPPLTLRDFTLAVTGDQVQLGNGLTLKCAPDDASCRDAAKDTIRTIVTELQNPYSGAGIASTRVLTAANTLPVLLTAKRDFSWRQLGAGEAGATERAVIDLGPLLASPAGYVYAVVDAANGQETRRYVVDAAFAKQLFDLLYQLPPEMGPVVAATPPPGLGLGDQVFVNAIDWNNVVWVLQTPNP